MFHRRRNPASAAPPVDNPPQIPLEDLQLVGMDGCACVSCGISVPIARQISTGKSGPFIEGHHTTDSICFRPDEVTDYVREQRLVLVPKAVSAFPGAVAVYTNPEFLAALGDSRQELIPTTHGWQEVPTRQTKPDGTEETVTTRIALLPENEAVRMLHSCAIKLLKQTMACLDNAVAENDPVAAARGEQLADYTLCAALRPDSLCADAYRQLGRALILLGREDALSHIYPIIQMQYPNWSLEQYVSECRSLTHGLGGKRYIRLSDISSDRPSYIRSLCIAGLDEIVQTRSCTPLDTVVYRIPADNFDSTVSTLGQYGTVTECSWAEVKAHMS